MVDCFGEVWPFDRGQGTSRPKLHELKYLKDSLGVFVSLVGYMCD